MSYALGVKTAGDTEWVTNALRFETEEEAEEYGRDLFSRWIAVKETKVLSSDDPINYKVIDGKAVRIEN